MSITARQLPSASAKAQIAAAYNEAGYRYGKYADGDGHAILRNDDARKNRIDRIAIPYGTAARKI